MDGLLGVSVEMAKENYMSHTPLHRATVPLLCVLTHTKNKLAYCSPHLLYRDRHIYPLLRATLSNTTQF